ncbi:MAG: TIGR01906 family membrane protein [Chloroflexota bacterium]
MAEATLTPESKPAVHHPFLLLLRGYITVTMPFLLALIAIRFVMSPLYLQLEYNRPDFPEDYYGFTQADRLNYAPYAIQYLLNGDDINFLGDLKFPDGSAMYNARELHHMRDVKVVTQYAYLLATIGGLAAILAGIYLYRNEPAKLRQALFGGALFTLGIIAAIIVIAIINWDFFFTSFHTLFFASGTWQFEYSDTLIRLFPEQFWFDASLIIGGSTVLGAVVILVISWRWRIVTSGIHK